MFENKVHFDKTSHMNFEKLLKNVLHRNILIDNKYNSFILY